MRVVLDGGGRFRRAVGQAALHRTTVEDERRRQHGHAVGEVEPRARRRAVRHREHGRPAQGRAVPERQHGVEAGRRRVDPYVLRARPRRARRERQRAARHLQVPRRPVHDRAIRAAHLVARRTALREVERPRERPVVRRVRPPRHVERRRPAGVAQLVGRRRADQVVDALVVPAQLPVAVELVVVAPDADLAVALVERPVGRAAVAQPVPGEQLRHVVARRRERHRPLRGVARPAVEVDGPVRDQQLRLVVHEPRRRLQPPPALEDHPAPRAEPHAVAAARERAPEGHRRAGEDLHGPGVAVRGGDRHRLRVRRGAEEQEVRRRAGDRHDPAARGAAPERVLAEGVDSPAARDPEVPPEVAGAVAVQVEAAGARLGDREGDGRRALPQRADVRHRRIRADLPRLVAVHDDGDVHAVRPGGRPRRRREAAAAEAEGRGRPAGGQREAVRVGRVEDDPEEGHRPVDGRARPRRRERREQRAVRKALDGVRPVPVPGLAHGAPAPAARPDGRRRRGRRARAKREPSHVKSLHRVLSFLPPSFRQRCGISSKIVRRPAVTQPRSA